MAEDRKHKNDHLIFTMLVNDNKRNNDGNNHLTDELLASKSDNALQPVIGNTTDDIDMRAEEDINGKTFLTLETSKKSVPDFSNGASNIIPGSLKHAEEDDEVLTELINIQAIDNDGKSVSNTELVEGDVETYTITDIEEIDFNPVAHVSEIARKQLESLAKDFRRPHNVPPEIESSNDSKNKFKISGTDSDTIMAVHRVRQGIKNPLVNLTSPILSKAEIEKEIKEKLLANKQSKSNLNILEHRILSADEKIKISPSTSSSALVAVSQSEYPSPENNIEIPHEFILSDYPTDDTISIPEQTSNNEEDLLAILEGDEDEIVEKKVDKQIAFEQILSLKKTARKKKDAGTATAPKSSKNQLVDILVQDWSDNETSEAGSDVTNSKEIEQEIKTETKSPTKIKHSPSPSTDKNILHTKKINNSKPPSATLEETKLTPQNIPVEPFKRSRIIKKKIIWDPDAPETQFSYASLIQASSSSAKKAIVKKTVVVKAAKSIISTAAPAAATTSEIPRMPKRKSVDISSVSPALKKKKTEIDKLLMDEGVGNMLQALEKENNNDDEERKKRISKPRITPTYEIEIATTSPAKPKPKTLKSASPKPNAKSQVKNKKSSRGSWDYVYKQRGGDDSMIIRRRSNSSYSSSSPRRLSLDASGGQFNSSTNDSIEPTETPVTAVKKPKGKLNNFEFVKPNDKQERVNKVQRKTPVKEVISLKKGVISESKNDIKSPIDYKRNNDYVEFTLTDSTAENFLTAARLDQISALLKDLEKDELCKVVLITSANSNFCYGIDVESLLNAKVEKNAKELATSVFNFIRSLMNFSKPLVTSLQGHVVNIGVTILPLFDTVVCDMSTVFQTTYGKLGQIPEGWAIINNSGRLHHNAISELFYVGNQVTHSQAMEKGLITNCLKAANYNSQVAKIVHNVASQSKQMLQSLKATKFRQNFIANVEKDLTDERNTLVKHWLSVECQEKFQKIALTNRRW